MYANCRNVTDMHASLRGPQEAGLRLCWYLSMPWILSSLLVCVTVNPSSTSLLESTLSVFRCTST